MGKPKNSAQGAADFAALSAEAAAAAGASSAPAETEAFAVAALNGFTNNQNGVAVTVNNPPKSGSHTSNGGAYEVIITQLTIMEQRLSAAAPQSI